MSLPPPSQIDQTALAIGVFFLAVLPAGGAVTLIACCVKLGWL